MPRRLLGSLVATAGVLMLPARAEPLTYRLDPDRSFVHFELVHFKTSTIRGRFGPVEGAVTLDRAAGSGYVGVRIATASVSTGIPVFDARIRAADLLDSGSFPEAYFVATQLRFDGTDLAELRGEFTLRGTSQPLTLKATGFACRDENEGGKSVEICGGEFVGDFSRSAFGAGFGVPFVADTVRLTVQVTGRRP